MAGRDAEFGQLNVIPRSESSEGLLAQGRDALQRRARNSSEVLRRVYEHHFAHQAVQGRAGEIARVEEAECEILLQGLGRRYAVEVSVGYGSHDHAGAGINGCAALFRDESEQYLLAVVGARGQVFAGEERQCAVEIEAAGTGNVHAEDRAAFVEFDAREAVDVQNLQFGRALLGVRLHRHLSDLPAYRALGAVGIVDRIVIPGRCRQVIERGLIQCREEIGVGEGVQCRVVRAGGPVGGLHGFVDVAVPGAEQERVVAVAVQSREHRAEMPGVERRELPGRELDALCIQHFVRVRAPEAVGAEEPVDHRFDSFAESVEFR